MLCQRALESFMTALRPFFDRLKNLCRILRALYVRANREFIRGLENSSALSAFGTRSSCCHWTDVLMLMDAKCVGQHWAIQTSWNVFICLLDESVIPRGIALSYKLNLLCREPLPESLDTFRLRGSLYRVE